MKRLAFAFVATILLSGCSPDPKKVVIPTDLATWEDLSPHTQRLTDDEQKLLAGYLTRAKMSEAVGNGGIPSGMTIGAAIANQQNYESAQASEAEALRLAISKLKLTLGRPRQEYGWYTLPVMIENSSDAAFDYVEVNCRFHSGSNVLLATDMTNWSGIAPGATVSGEITSNAFRASEVAKTDCSIDAN